MIETRDNNTGFSLTPAKVAEIAANLENLGLDFVDKKASWRVLEDALEEIQAGAYREYRRLGRSAVDAKADSVVDRRVLDARKAAREADKEQSAAKVRYEVAQVIKEMLQSSDSNNRALMNLR
jgi:hypothetical protein